MMTKETTNNIAILFKTTRKFHRLQQTEFSAILGVTQGTISKIESSMMSPELGLWFKFLKAFNIQDPYCFTYAGIEYNESAFQNLKTEGSPFAPKFDFKNATYLFNVRRIRPLFDFVLKNHSKALEEFLKENKINKEIFYILNHPLTSEFVDSFFAFLEENKINAKSVALLDLNFDSALGRQMENLRSIDSSADIISILNNDGDSLLEYEVSNNKGEYFINLKKEDTDSLKALKESDFVMNYNILYPYHFMKSAKNLKVSSPVISEVKKDQRWQVLYA
jgi:DNA-binding XRE family transcriptional regulator